MHVKIDKNGLGHGAVGMLEVWGDNGKHDSEIIGVMVSESPDRDDPGATMRPYTSNAGPLFSKRSFSSASICRRNRST
ncbi:hypothetical protein ACVHNB_15815 [Streptomyces sp. YJ-C3]